MYKPKTLVDLFYSRIKNNPILAIFIILGTIVIGLSAFTNAAKNLFELSIRPPDINGEWTANVSYDWNNASYKEIFSFQVIDNGVRHLFIGMPSKPA